MVLFVQVYVWPVMHVMNDVSSIHAELVLSGRKQSGVCAGRAVRGGHAALAGRHPAAHHPRIAAAPAQRHVRSLRFYALTPEFVCLRLVIFNKVPR